MGQRIKTSYPGVYYRKVRRLGKKGTERVYYVTFKKDGRMVEEKVGRQYVDDMTAAKAAARRGQRIEGRRPSLREVKQGEKIKGWTFISLWDEYTAHRGSVTHADKSRFFTYIKPTVGNKEPRDLTSTDIKNLKQGLLKGKSDGTVYAVLALISRLASFGVKTLLCEGINFKIEKPRVNNEVTETLTTAQLKGLLKVLTEDGGDIAHAMLMALFTGMRKMEILKLKWADVDFDMGFIHIRDPKGGRDQRIPLNDQARALLNSRMRKGEHVFTGPHGPYSKEVYAEANRLKKAAQLPEDFRPFHGLRHVFASLLASSGKVDLYVLQKLLTHKNPVQTQRYAHLRDEALKNGSNVMSDIMGEL